MAVLIAIALLSTMLVVPATAASSEARTEKTIEAFFTELLGAKAEVDEKLLSEILKKSGSSPTEQSVAKAVSRYAVVPVESASALDVIAETVATDSVYTIKTLENGKKTIYVAVDIVKHPELFEKDIFRKAVYEICDRQIEFVEREAEFDLLGYTRFAGELYLHMVIYRVVDPFVDTLGSAIGIIMKVYNMAKVADMNIDEKRFPEVLMNLIGEIMMRI